MLSPNFAPLTPIVCFIACTLAVCLIGCGGDKQQPADTLKTPGRFAIFATCDTQGWIEPCGCASGQSGGLSRRATLIDDLAGDDERLLVSVGGAALGNQPYDVEKFKAIIDGEEEMGYLIHNIGASELNLDLPETDGLTFLSTNLSTPPPNIKSSVHVRKGAARILVLGVVSPKLAPKNSRWEIQSPERSILNAIDQLSLAPDCVVVLAYMDQDELKELASNVPEVDVIIGGKTGQSIAPTKYGRTLLTAVANKGKFVARVQGETAGKFTSVKADLHEVSSKYDEDSVQQANLVSFRDRLAELDFPASKTSFVPAASDDGNQFAGSESCQDCHESDTEIWKDTPHAHAWHTLEEVGAHVDSSCQRCHTIGFGGNGGFVNRKTTMNRIDVGCESCHGPSSKHVADETVKTPWLAADSCLVCHDHENSPHFEYDSYWSQVEHGNRETSDGAE